MNNRDLFSDISCYNEFKSGDFTWTLPLRYRTAQGFTALYTANSDAIASILPSTRFKLYRTSPHRVPAILLSFDYLDTDVGPYGECGSCFPVALMHEGTKYRGVFVHQLPVTTELAKIAGIESYGFPKFVAEMEHVNGSKVHSVRIREGDRHIMDLSIEKGGFTKGFSGTLNMFTIKDDEIILSRFIMQTVVRFRPFGPCTLTLGDHPMADAIRAYDLSDRPMMTGELLDSTLVLLEGVSLGQV